MIRDATAQDIPALLGMGAKFHEAAQIPIRFDYSSFLTTLSALIKSKGLLVLGDDPVGMIGVTVQPAFYNADAVLAHEMFWWVNPEYRGTGITLFNALEIRAKELGADILYVSCLETSRPETVSKFYKRRGYRPVDHFYYKVI